MVKRIVDTNFWTSMQVIDHYSVEDKYFALYLMTNARSSQVGIYSLPKKIISFETGYTNEVIQVLIDRFSKEYKQIIYSEKTQEVSLLKSLEYSILRGGKPVSDLLERELKAVQEVSLIQTTYQTMLNHWQLSNRNFDKTIQSLFEAELRNRGIETDQSQMHQNQNQKQNDNDNHNDKKNHNQNHNQESYATSRPTNRGLIINNDQTDEDELDRLDSYLEILKTKNISFDEQINSSELLVIVYEKLFGEASLIIRKKLEAWEQLMDKSLIIEAFMRSIDKYNPISYASTVIENWEKNQVKDLRDVSKLDRAFDRKNYLS